MEMKINCIFHWFIAQVQHLRQRQRQKYFFLFFDCIRHRNNEIIAKITFFFLLDLSLRLLRRQLFTIRFAGHLRMLLWIPDRAQLSAFLGHRRKSRVANRRFDTESYRSRNLLLCSTGKYRSESISYVLTATIKLMQPPWLTARTQQQFTFETFRLRKCVRVEGERRENDKRVHKLSIWYGIRLVNGNINSSNFI